MERIAKPLLTVLLAWLVTLFTGVVSAHAAGVPCRNRPGQQQTGGRPYIPGKKGVPRLRDDKVTAPSRLLEVPFPGMLPSDQPRSYLTLSLNAFLPLPCPPRESRFLSPRVLLI